MNSGFLSVVPDFLDESIIENILVKFRESRLFEVNSREINGNGRWPNSLSSGSSGLVLVLRLDEFKDDFLKAFRAIHPLFEEYRSLTCFLHVWLKGSHINWHHDGAGGDNTDRISGTIYLNRVWDRNWGGLLLYVENDGSRKWLAPEFNTMNWFITPMYHSTSAVTQSAEEPRLSVQLFFDR